MSQAGHTDEHALPTGMSHTQMKDPSQMKVNLTEVFLTDASTADNPLKSVWASGRMSQTRLQGLSNEAW